MAIDESCCTFIRGEFFMAEAKSACDSTGGIVCGIVSPLKKIGNIQSAVVTIQSEVLGKENKYNSNGINPCSRIQVNSVSIALSIVCPKTKNMELALQSKEFEPTSLVGYVQEYTLCDSASKDEGNLFVFEKSGVNLGTVVVQLLNISNVVVATLVLGTNYSVSAHGIELLTPIVTVGAIYLRVTYSYDEENFNEFNFLSEFKGPKYLYFKGTNFGDSEENPLGVEFHKVLFSPVSQLDLISQGNYFVLNLVGQIEKEFVNSDLGLGGYFKLRR
jgi:hypothetical protein